MLLSIHLGRVTRLKSPITQTTTPVSCPARRQLFQVASTWDNVAGLPAFWRMATRFQVRAQLRPMSVCRAPAAPIALLALWHPGRGNALPWRAAWAGEPPVQ